jgi:ABC-type transport system substrate-binding protein
LTSSSNIRLNYATPFVYERKTIFDVTTDLAQREAMAIELQEFLYETVPAITAFWRVQAVTAVKGIGGMNLSSNQFEHNLRGIYWNLDETPARLRP